MKDREEEEEYKEKEEKQVLEEDEEGNGVVSTARPDTERQKLKNALRFLKEQDWGDARQGGDTNK